VLHSRGSSVKETKKNNHGVSLEGVGGGKASIGDRRETDFVREKLLTKKKGGLGAAEGGDVRWVR